MSYIKGLSDGTQSALAVGVAAAAIPCLPMLSQTGLAATNLASMGTQFGTQMWVSLVAGPTMFMNMERHAFGDLQSRLFPKFGMVGVSTGMLGLASYHIAHPSPDSLTAVLACSALVHILNTFVLFPVTTRFMYERRKHEEGTDEFKKASKKFGITHGISNLVNLAGLALNVAYFYLLATKIAGSW